MAVSNHERVGKGLELLKDSLGPFIERELKAQHGNDWFEQAKDSLSGSQANFAVTAAAPRWDVAAVLAVMWNQWQLVFRKTLRQADRTLVTELRDGRNRSAHQNPFSTDDTYRLDSAGRLLTAVSTSQADDLEKIRVELLHVRFDEQERGERRKRTGAVIESQAAGGLKPWRDVVPPHKLTSQGLEND